MSKLNRRALFGTAGLLATAPLITEVEAEQQYPPEGYTFCDGSEGIGWAWERRFGAEISAHEAEIGRYDVLFNGEKHPWVFAVKAGPNGWIAEGVMREYQNEYGTQRTITACECVYSKHVLLRITYGDVQLVDHWAQEV